MKGKLLARVKFSLWCTLKFKKKSQKVKIGKGLIKRHNDCKAHPVTNYGDFNS